MLTRKHSKNQARLVLFIAVLAAMVAFIVLHPSVEPVQAQNPSDYKNFEGPQVHPLAITPDGTRLLAVNTPNGSLSVFHLTGNTLTRMAEIPVGLEPVSVAARNNNEAWVVNWLSDSVSVIDLNRFKTTRTFDVGDEPTDIVFAGLQKEFAFVCVSGTSEVKVFDPAAPATSPQLIALRAKQPRALARDSAGSQVFVSVFESGNQTTVVSAAQVAGAGGPPPPSPAMSNFLPTAPDVGLIVTWNGNGWTDETGNAKWSSVVPYTLADTDVAVIDAHGLSPFISTLVRGVGTHIGNAVFDAGANRLLVVNDEARNLVRFEPNLRGHFLTSRISAIPFSGNSPAVSVSDLNSHINFSNPAGSDSERALSLALPADVVRAADGTTFVAANGSAKIGVLDSQGVVQARISVGQGPTGLALNSPRNLLYVLNRFDETIGIVDLPTRTQIATIPIGINPEPDNVRNGRRFLYDTTLSAHGDVSCASCHQNGHRDGLAWDLGDPQGQMQVVTGSGALGAPSIFHPMKGPMTTQSLRGIIGTEPLHWRGDRAALGSFNPAFQSLLGGQRQLTPSELNAFESFTRSLTYPPNPNENPDRTLPNPLSGPNATRGAQLFNNLNSDAGVFTCNQCHTVTPGFGPGTNELIIPAVALAESQDFKVPQLRGEYQKLGMVNAPGEQISGFGFIHDGSTDSLFSFLHAPVFIFQNDGQRRDIEQFVISLDTGTAPAVGLEITVNGTNKGTAPVTDRVNLLMSQANLGNCDLVVRGIYNGASRGFLFSGGQFQTDKQGEAPLSSQTLLQAAGNGSELTFLGVPAGAGRRLSIDRDANGILDGDQVVPNAIDSAQFFVWQHYLDFLGRDPDPSGLAFWTNQINSCGNDEQCIAANRVNVSAAYFLSIEFKETGYLVERLYKSGYGDASGASTLGGAHSIPVPAVRFGEFLTDTQQIGQGVIVGQSGWEALLESNKQSFASAFVQRARFTAAFPTVMPPAQFVDTLNQNAGSVLSAAERTTAINLFAGAGDTSNQAARAQALRQVAEDQDLLTAESNKAFVLMQFFGYLRRDPNSGPDTDYTGYDFWLTKLNQFNGNYINAEMVKAFLNSSEYRQRFGL